MVRVPSISRATRFPWVFFAGTILIAAWAFQTKAAGIDATAEQPSAYPPRENWLSYNGDFSGRRYSGLSQITPENVSRLRAQWVFHSNSSDRLEVTPVVTDGLMLITSANDAHALDARTGRQIWHHSMPKT